MLYKSPKIIPDFDGIAIQNSSYSSKILYLCIVEISDNIIIYKCFRRSIPFNNCNLMVALWLLEVYSLGHVCNKASSIEHRLLILHFVYGQEKTPECIWPLNMHLLTNIWWELSESSFLYFPGLLLNRQNPYVFKALGHCFKAILMSFCPMCSFAYMFRAQCT